MSKTPYFSLRSYSVLAIRLAKVIIRQSIAASKTSTASIAVKKPGLSIWGTILTGPVYGHQSAWTEVSGTNEDDMTRDIKVMGPLQKKGRTYMVPRLLV
jgi:hypothetical protein